MRKVLLCAFLAAGVAFAAVAQETDPVELLLNLALTQDEVREILADGNDAWVLESKAAVPRPPAGAVGISFSFSQNTQLIKAVIYEFETVDGGAAFVELGVGSVLAQLSGDPANVIEREEFLDPDAGTPLVEQAVVLSFSEDRDSQLIFLRANPEAGTAIVVLIRSNLNEDQIITLGASQLQKLIQEGGK